MDLGQWVEFDTIIVKDRSATGTQVTSKQLRRTHAGIIVGLRPVYDAQPGSPPVLTNRRLVALVATSLHTCYRVFPADLCLLSGPPQRGRRRKQAATPPPSPVVADDDDRELPSDAELALWVADALNQSLATGIWFTAYDVTVAIRTAHPLDNIVHSKVREIVHGQMQTILQSGLYQSETATFGSTQAIRYVPQ